MHSAYLALAALLLCRNDLEVSRIQCTLLRRALSAFLSHLTPSATSSLGLRRARGATSIKDAFVSQLATAQEFLGEMARIEGVRRRMYNFSDELDVWREAQEGSDEIVGYVPLVTCIFIRR